MAAAVVSFAVERLGDLLISEAKLLHGVRDVINDVQRQLEGMLCVLEEVDKKQNEDKRLQKWVTDMRELAFKVEDVIETFALDVATKKQKSGFKKTLRRFACILNEGLSCHSVAMEIDTIKTQLTHLSASLLIYGITKEYKEKIPSSSLVDLKTPRNYFQNVEEDFVGMKKDIDQMITHLKREDRGCEVLSICGMGGQGKTTLAKKLYTHATVKSHFKAFAWVCISRQFHKGRVLKEILNQLLPAHTEKEVSTMTDAKLAKELYDIQNENNCFIVIDDMWTIDCWRSLKSAFPVGETMNASKILLITRDEMVAKLGSPYRIQGLTEEEGWQLLSKKARIDDLSEKLVTSQMETIGRNLVKRCEGLPLTISALGGLLRGKSLTEW